jgi:hypothetical protein
MRGSGGAGDIQPAGPPPIPNEIEAPAPVILQRGTLEVVPQLSVITLSDLSLPIPGYRVNYLGSMSGLPQVMVSVGTSFAAWGDLGFSAHLAVGYGGRAADFSAFSMQSTPPTPLAPQSLRLHWIPMTISGKVTYRPPHLPSIRPSLSLGAGNLLVIQSSSDSAFSRTLGIPILVVSPQLNFVDLSTFHWLGGFSFGATWVRSLSASSSVNGVSLDLGFNLLL